MIFDSHAHYDDEAFDIDREELLTGMTEQGVECIVNASSSIASLEATLALAARFPFIYGTLGIHPSETGLVSEENLEWIKNKCLEKEKAKIVAIGEIGLDYYWDRPARDVQKLWFVRQIALAKEVGLPIVIHSREAALDTLAMMRSENADDVGGVMHCFSYTQETARECLKLGFFLGIGGVVTFKNAQKIKDVVDYAPLDRILIETDAPYLAPVPYRGKRNVSPYLTHVAEAIAEIKGLTSDEVIRRTNENACGLFNV